MKTLAIDIETYSSYELIKTGVYRYVEAPDFEILLFAYSFDDGPVEVVDLTEEELPQEVFEALTDKNILKTAFNAQFEMVCIEKHFDIKLDISQWQCTMIHSLILGLPSSLADVAKALRIEEQKDTAGTQLINYFSKPCKPTKANGGRTRNLPKHAPEKWEAFKRYNKQDVVVEKAIKKKLNRFPMPEREQYLWELDQKINRYGVRSDDILVKNAIKFHNKETERLMDEAKRITNLENPNSTEQLRKWIEQQGVEMPNMQAGTVKKIIKSTDNKAVKKVLKIRKGLSKTSVKKYFSLDAARCNDGRIRGLIQHYGANRTGRSAGRLAQIQNLPGIKLSLKDLETARNLVKQGDFETFQLLYDVPDTLSQLIRTAIIPEEGHRLIVADFSAIEARVIAWLANEKWRLEVFKTHGKIYEASASQMFNVPIEQITKGSELRQKGKIAELALGYQGSVGAMKSMGADEMGLTENEMAEIVTKWRNTNSKIVEFWYDVQNAALEAVKKRSLVELQHGIRIYYESGIMFIKLPSGRKLAYVRPRIKENKFGREAVFFDGTNGNEESTYGGKLVENIVQATSRDVLFENIVKLDKLGYKVIFHVHDEIVCEMPHGKGSVEQVEHVMSEPIEWAPGLPLSAEGFETSFYMKG